MSYVLSRTPDSRSPALRLFGQEFFELGLAALDSLLLCPSCGRAGPGIAPRRSYPIRRAWV